MSKTFRHCFLFLAVCAMAGFAGAVLTVRPGLAQDDPRHQVRMGVDFTVLPVVLPDGTEAPATPAPAPEPEGEETLPPETAKAGKPADQAKPGPAQSAKPESPADKGRTEPAPAPAPKAPAPAQEARTPAITLPRGAGMIRSVTLDETSRGFSLIVIADRAVGDTEILNLNNPRRLVVDILGKWRHKGGSVIRSEGMVKHVVMGEHPDRFRMVVHFRIPPQKPLVTDIKKAGDEVHVLVAAP